MSEADEIRNGEVNQSGGESVEQIKAQLEELQNTVKSLQTAKEDLERKVEEYESELLSPDYLSWRDRRSKGDDVGEKEDEIDLETASSADIVRFVEKKYKGDLKGVQEEMLKKVDEINEKLGMAMARIDVELTALKHNDFWEYAKEIQKIANENPTWSAEKCYKQAKLEAKMKEEEKLEEEKKRAEEERRIVTEKGGVPPSLVKERELTPEEAAEIGYRAAFGSKEL